MCMVCKSFSYIFFFRCDLRCQCMVCGGSHLPKLGYKPKKNEQFLKYQKIECSYHRHSENSFKKNFCWKIFEIWRVLYLLLWLWSKILWHHNYLLKKDIYNVSNVSKFGYVHPKGPLWCIWLRYTWFITIII